MGRLDLPCAREHACGPYRSVSTSPPQLLPEYISCTRAICSVRSTIFQAYAGGIAAGRTRVQSSDNCSPASDRSGRSHAGRISLLHDIYYESNLEEPVPQGGLSLCTQSLRTVAVVDHNSTCRVRRAVFGGPVPDNDTTEQSRERERRRPMSLATPFHLIAKPLTHSA